MELTATTMDGAGERGADWSDGEKGELEDSRPPLLDPPRSLLRLAIPLGGSDTNNVTTY